jgi:hypothetical protein
VSAVRHHFYGGGLAMLGVWELAALTSRGRVPTVTRTTRGHRVRTAVLLTWMLGAAVHVLRSPS